MVEDRKEERRVEVETDRDERPRDVCGTSVSVSIWARRRRLVDWDDRTGYQGREERQEADRQRRRAERRICLERRRDPQLAQNRKERVGAEGEAERDDVDQGVQLEERRKRQSSARASVANADRGRPDLEDDDKECSELLKHLGEEVCRREKERTIS